MKATILFGSLTIIISSIVYIYKPTNAVGSGVYVNTDLSNKQSVFTSSTVCPVVGNQFKTISTTESSSGEEQPSYEHCVACNTGVYLPSKEGVLHCTFCGKQKE